MITPLIEEVSAFLPFISVAGNHDIDRGDNDWSYYLSQPFLKETDSTTLYRDGKGICTLMNSNGTEVLFVGLGYDMTDQDAIRWAKDVFEEHPLATGVFLTHSYLGYATSKTSMYTKNGVLFRDRLVAACPQISFVLSGHKKGACHIVERYDDDGNGTAERIVHVMRYNYQGNKTLKRAGFLRVLTVFPSSGRLRVYTYAPYSDLEVCDPRFSKQEYFFIEGLV